eukprot:SAG11_NODE_9600_length_897_cov_0.867168_1_plen_158_part_10
MPEGLKQIIGSIAIEVQGLKRENGALRNRTDAMEAELWQAKTAEQSLQTQVQNLRTRVAARCGSTANARRAQAVEPEPEPQAPGEAEVVRIFKRSLSTTHLSGRVDESNGGHRLLAEGAPAPRAQSKAAVTMKAAAASFGVIWGAEKERGRRDDICLC